MWKKIKTAWKQAYESAKKPWKECWEAFKTALLGFVSAIALFVWGILQLVFQTVLVFLKSAGIILFGWLVDWIKRW